MTVRKAVQRNQGAAQQYSLGCVGRVGVVAALVAVDLNCRQTSTVLVDGKVLEVVRGSSKSSGISLNWWALRQKTSESDEESGVPRQLTKRGSHCTGKLGP